MTKGSSDCGLWVPSVRGVEEAGGAGRRGMLLYFSVDLIHGLGFNKRTPRPLVWKRNWDVLDTCENNNEMDAQRKGGRERRVRVERLTL